MGSLEQRITDALGTLGKRSFSEASANDTANRKPNKRLLFRPWDQKDLHRRLETYRPLTWFAKPDAANAVACASKGWINDARDSLCCEFCSVKLLYPQSKTFEERARAVALFAEQLSQRHAPHCPWRSTRCDDAVLAFDPSAAIVVSPGRALTPADTLRDAFLSRLSNLEHVDLLPDMYPRALEQLTAQAASNVLCVSTDRPHRDRAWGPDSLRRALALPVPQPPLDGTDIPPAFNPSSPIVLPAKLTRGQKARLLALLGWDAEELPPGSADRPRHAASIYRPTAGAYSLAHLVGAAAPAPRPQQQQPEEENSWSMDNVVLNCHNCKSRVGLWSFVTQPPAPPAPSVPSCTITELPNDPMVSASPSPRQTVSGAVEPSRPSLSSAPMHPTASVPLAGTIAGGTYTGAGLGRLSSSGAGVFGSPRIASVPVYGLHALAAQAPRTATGQAGTEAGGGHKRKHSVTSLAECPMGAAVVGEEADGAKRARITASPSPQPDRQLFDPLQHHRLWCPWVFTGSKSAPGGTTPAATPGTSTAPTQQPAAHASGIPSSPSVQPGTVPTTPVPTSATAASGPRIRCGWMHLLESMSQDTSAAGNTAAGDLFSARCRQTPGAAGMASPGGVTAGTPTVDAGPAGMDVDVPEILAGGPAPRDIMHVKDSIISTLRGI